MWQWVLLGLAILVILFYRSRENMSNDELIDTLKQFENKGTKNAEPSKEFIYGPSANPPAFTNTGAGGGKSVAGPYPQIFGPDVKPAPGSGRGSGGAGGAGGGSVRGGTGLSGNTAPPEGQVASDQPLPPEDQAYQFNPELAKAFPVDGPPQPFLTDFSKIQH
jgi:hypothetical protein